MSDEQCPRCGYMRNEQAPCRCGNLKAETNMTPDTNATPRTDAVDSACGVSGDFARQLERELNENLVSKSRLRMLELARKHEFELRKDAEEYSAKVKAERDALKARISDLESSNFNLQSKLESRDKDYLTALDEWNKSESTFKSEVEELRKDKARLDWLLENSNICFETMDSSIYPSCRETIDAAMKGQP